MLTAAPKFEVSITHVAFAGDKSLFVFRLPWWYLCGGLLMVKCIFIFAQLISPSL